MSQKSILITGCSSGIGYDAAHTLNKRGWSVFATCRADADCERLRGEGLESFRLDYQDESSIESAINEVLTRTGGTLDALFNNGAYAIPGAIEDMSRDAMRDIFETNVFGQIDLSNRLIPVMRKQGFGRVIFNSSVLGFISTPYRGSYCGTKFALEALVDAQRMEHKDSPLEFILIEPGPITTEFGNNAIKQFEKWIDRDATHHNDAYTAMLDKRNASAGKKDFSELPPSAVTKKLIHALESRRPNPRYYVTWATHFAGIMRRILPTRLLDSILSRQ
ncbi:MAG: SDR family NAD(P)-dependent oxidoreductase [Paracoccaceae bacterium]|jgi:NAD(P)-dependent dehydrogenase (short-subunit alcohol dehydrogenase family)